MTPSDPLSDVLRSVRLRGAAFFYVGCGEEWVSVAPPSGMVGPTVMPGSEHVIAYHLMVKGDGWVGVDGEAQVPFSAGEVALMPHGDGHTTRARRAWCRSRTTAHGSFGCATIRSRSRSAITMASCSRAELPVAEATAILICGFIGCDVKPFNPLIGALPRLLHLPAGGVGAWVVPALQQAVSESREQRSGNHAVLERLSEMLFVDASCRYLVSLDENASGWLAALRDRHVGRAIGLPHERLADAWTVEELGREVGLSRSALHERFVALVGQPPMQYLADWRIHRAAQLLRESDASVLATAQDVGYESEASFSRAVKRLVGQPPAAWRRLQRQVV